MLGKLNRIKNRKVIEELFKKGMLFKDPLMLIRYKKTGAEPSRFAVAVSKKIHKKAVRRNHLRRQVHEALRLNLKKMKEGVTAYITLRPAATERNVSFQDLVKSAENFFNFIQKNAE